MRRSATPYAVCFAVWAGLACGADFPATVGGFLDRHCIDCHAGSTAEMGLALDTARGEADMAADRSRWRKIVSRVAAGEMPPADASQPDAAEREAFLRAVREAFARADSATPPDPGPTLIRRLSRDEYDNTLRDLFRTDFRVGNSLPADGVGYGFDTIADVLTVSPLLMDRYLDTAEEVARRVLPAVPPKPFVRQIAGKWCAPKNPHVPKERFRPIRAGLAEPTFSGPLHIPATIDAAEEYVVRARVYATAADDRPVKAVLMAAGAGIEQRLSPAELATLPDPAASEPQPRLILAVHEITARSPAEAQTIEAPLVRTAGVEQVLIGVQRPDPGTSAPTLHVEWLAYTGPRDTREPATRAFLRADPALPPAEQARDNLAGLARRAWRRPVEPAVVDRLCSIVDDAVAGGETQDDGVRRAIAAILASPEFVFRIEGPPPPGSTGAVPVPDVELASRLSYFVWSSCPDEELLDLAARGELGANLDAQVKRMLADPRSSALVDRFAMQWLGLERLTVHGVDTERFPDWRPEIGASMIEETRRFIAEVIRGDGSLLSLLDADFTWVNAGLAKLYGLEPEPPLERFEWRRVAVDRDLRGGLLGQAAILTVTSNPARTSPVKRGKWVLERLLDAPPPMAPPDVPSIDDKGRRQLTGTLRQRMEQHRADPRCAGCHQRMDAFGFALEEFDAMGRLRQHDDDGLPIDASSDVGSRRLAGITGLKAYLLERKEDFIHSLAKKMLIYALGRGLEPRDEPALAAIERAVENDGYRFSALVHAVVHSVPFRMRRGADLDAAAASSRSAKP